MTAVWDIDLGLAGFFHQVFACGDEAAVCLARRATDRVYPPRTLILRQGDPAGATVVMISGRAQAFAYGVDGRSVLLQDFKAGDVFGAVAPSGPQAQDSDVLTTEASRAAVFGALDFLVLMERHSALGVAVSRRLLDQLRTARGRIAERSTLSATGRVYAELLRLASLADGRTIRPIPNLAALAVRVQSTRETVSRAIGAAERRGVIRREDDALIVLALKRLEELVL